MLTDEETTDLQFAIDANDADAVARIIAPHSSEDLSGVQFYGNSTVLMYACERSTPEVVKCLLSKKLTTFELPFSDNNEIKAAISNRSHGPAMLAMIVKIVPKELMFDMITSTWDPEDPPQPHVKSAFQIAEKLPDPACKDKLLEELDRLKKA